MRVGSLFAGIGGFDLAAERAGMEVVWQSEIDAKASAVLDYHWPAVKNLGDIHGIETPSFLPTVDVLTGGFPCQDYSVAGNRGGLAGDRGALWWEYHRLINSVRPTWVLGENVPGLLSSRDGEDFATIVGSLTELGYGVAWAVLDAQYFGVAQRRRRVFIVGHSGGQPRPEILALSEGMFGHPEPSREPGENSAPTLAARTRGGGGLGTDTELDGGLIPTTVGPLTTHMQSPRGSETTDSDHVLAFTSKDYGADIGELSPTLRSMNYADSHINGGGQVAVAVPIDDVRDLKKHQNGVGVGEPGDPSYTLDTRQHFGVGTGSTVRRLTPIECERLQGFPDGWTDIPGNSDSQRYRQLGNAVAVPVVEWILRRVAAS